jgi:hypothetical protein
MSKISKILESLNRIDEAAKLDKKHLTVLYDLAKARKLEMTTEVYTLKPFQRNVIDTMSSGYFTEQKILENYTKTLADGFFHVNFNTSSENPTFIKNLELILNAKGQFELRRVALNQGNKQVIPGFNFMGLPVRGVIFETRLFKIK